MPPTPEFMEVSRSSHKTGKSSFSAVSLLVTDRNVDGDLAITIDRVVGWSIAIRAGDLTTGLGAERRMKAVMVQRGAVGTEIWR